MVGKSEVRRQAKGGLSRSETRKFVENHPASQTIMPRNIDRSMFGHAEPEVGRSLNQGEHVAHMELSEQFISGFGEERSVDVMAWMDELKADSSSFIASRFDELVQEEARMRRYRTAVSSVIDKIFQDLRYFAFEFNKVARGTSMQMVATTLGEVTEVIQVNSKREVEASATYFRARLANRHYALVLRGADRRIEFYLVPVAQVMGQSTVESQYRPMASMEIRLQGEDLSWRLLGGEPANLPNGSIEELSMFLFGTLVDVTKQEVRRIEAEGGVC